MAMRATAPLSLSQIQLIKLETERENRSDTGGAQEKSREDLARTKRKRIEVETQHVEKQLALTAQKNVFSQALGSFIQGMAQTIGDVKNMASDVVSFVSPEAAAVIGVAFGGHLAAGAVAVGALVPAIVGATLSTLTVGKVVDAVANICALDTGSEVNDLRKALNTLDRQILELESAIAKSDGNESSKKSEERRTKQKLRQANDLEEQVHMAKIDGMKGRVMTVLQGSKIPEGVQLAQTARAMATLGESQDVLASTREMQLDIEQMRSRALEIQIKAGDEQWRNEKARTWIDFGIAVAEVAATVLTLGASAMYSATGTAITAGKAAAQAAVQATQAGLQLAKATVSLASAGLGIASSFITDDNAKAKQRNAEAIRARSDDVQRRVDKAKASAEQLAYEVDQTLDIAVRMMELAEYATPAAAGNRGAIQAQLGIARTHLETLRDSIREQFAAAGRAVGLRLDGVEHRRDEDGASRSKNHVSQGIAIGSAALSAVGFGFSLDNASAALAYAQDVAELGRAVERGRDALEAVNEAFNAFRNIASAGGGLATALMDDGADDARDARLKDTESERHRLDADAARDAFVKSRSSHQRAYEQALELQRNLAPSRA